MMMSNLPKLRKCVSQVHFKNILCKIHFEKYTLQSKSRYVCKLSFACFACNILRYTSFTCMLDQIPGESKSCWSKDISHPVVYGSRDTDTMEIWKCDRPTNQLFRVGNSFVYAFGDFFSNFDLLSWNSLWF